MNSGQIFTLIWGISTITIFVVIGVVGLIQEHRRERERESAARHARRIYTIYSDARQQMWQEADNQRRSGGS
jgi:hypothetical protein